MTHANPGDTPLVVALDTAGPVIGVAARHGDRVAVRTQRSTRGSEGLLLPWAVAVCEELGLTLQDVGGVAVATGPGAFTGLRVGLASAAGLAMSLGVPLWGGSSLASRAARAFDGRPLLTMLDARKKKVYAQLTDASGGVIRPPADVPPEEALSWVDGPFLATGEGAVVYAEDVLRAGGELAPYADDPAVDTLAALAVAGLARGEGRAPIEVAPTYLRPPDARPSDKGRISPRGGNGGRS